MALGDDLGDDLSNFLRDHERRRQAPGSTDGPTTPMTSRQLPDFGSPSPPSGLQTPAPLDRNTSQSTMTTGDLTFTPEPFAPTLCPVIDPQLRSLSLGPGTTPDHASNKRPAYDLQQYAAREIISKKLKGEHKDGFIKWSKVSKPPGRLDLGQ